MANDRIVIENTKFIYRTNFSGDPANDRFGSPERKGNVILPRDVAMQMREDGYNVRETHPREDDDPETFEPTYYVAAKVAYRTRAGEPVKYPPNIYLVDEGYEPVKLDEDTIATLDAIRAKDVNVVMSGREYDPINHRKSLYIRTMYVTKGEDDDPWANRFTRGPVSAPIMDEEEPF